MPIHTIKGSILPGPTMEGKRNQRLDEDRLRKASADFEAVFINQMFKSMRATVPRSELFGGGPSKDIVQSLFDEELSRVMAKRGGIGLGEMIYRQMSRRPPPQAEGKKIGKEE